MKRLSLLILITIICSNIYSQISFEQGYYINNSGQKINCQIKNIAWKNNPTIFEHRLSTDNESKKATIESVKEFAIDSISKYIRATVNIDRSSENVAILSTIRSPIFKEETLFLKVLVEGDATLYQYKDKDITRYFYKKDSSKIEQLIYKSYKTKDDKIIKNNSFRNQLWNNLKCSTIKSDIVEHLDYKKSDLINYFVKYNEDKNGTYISYEENQHKDLVQFKS